MYSELAAISELAAKLLKKPDMDEYIPYLSEENLVDPPAPSIQF